MKRTLLIFILIALPCFAEPEFVLVGVRSDVSATKKQKLKEKLDDLGIEAKPIKLSDGTNQWLVANFWRQQLNQTMTPEKFTAITNAVADSVKFFVVATDDPQAVLAQKGLK